MLTNDDREFKRLLDIQLHGTPEEAIKALQAEKTLKNQATVNKLIRVLQSEQAGESVESYAARRGLK